MGAHDRPAAARSRRRPRPGVSRPGHRRRRQHDCADLADQINDLGVALLAADPLLSLIAAGIDTHRDRELRTALEPLAQLADTTSCAVVGLAHFNKSTTTTDVLNLITGSRAFSSLTRVVLAIARDPDAEDDSCVLSVEKNNVGRRDLPALRYVIDSVGITTPEDDTEVGKLRFTGETDRTVSDILNAGNHTKPQGDNDRVGQWLHDQLTALGGKAPAAQLFELAAEDGTPDRTLRNARKRIGVIATRSGFAAGSIWQLCDDHAPSTPTQPGHIPASSGQDTGAGRNGPNGRNDATTDDVPSLHVVQNLPLETPHDHARRYRPSRPIPGRLQRRSRRPPRPRAPKTSRSTTGSMAGSEATSRRLRTPSRPVQPDPAHTYTRHHESFTLRLGHPANSHAIDVPTS